MRERLKYLDRGLLYTCSVKSYLTPCPWPISITLSKCCLSPGRARKVLQIFLQTLYVEAPLCEMKTVSAPRVFRTCTIARLSGPSPKCKQNLLRRMDLYLSQHFRGPSLQAPHVLSRMIGCTTTLSPIRIPFTNVSSTSYIVPLNP